MPNIIVKFKSEGEPEENYELILTDNPEEVVTNIIVLALCPKFRNAAANKTSVEVIIKVTEEEIKKKSSIISGLVKINCGKAGFEERMTEALELYVEIRDFDEVAKIMKVKAPTVYTHLRRAKLIINKLFVNANLLNHFDLIEFMDKEWVVFYCIFLLFY